MERRRKTAFDDFNDIERTVKFLLKRPYTVRNQKIVLKKRGWTFEWIHSKNSFGRTSIRPRENKKVVKLSVPLCGVNLTNRKAILDVILHEIAHALQYEVAKRLSHDFEWKRIARSIGCSANIRYDITKVNMPMSKYTLTCPVCGQKSPAHRRPTRSRSCGICSSHYDEKYLLKVTQNY